MSAAGAIRTLPLATPFSIGDVNAYLLEGEPLTLVDCGPNSATALLALERQLAELGRELGALEQVLVTHQHVDHCGLAAAVVERSGARLAAIAPVAPYLAHWNAAAEQEAQHAEALLRRHGVDEGPAAAVLGASRGERAWGAPVTVDERLADGAVVRAGGRELTALHRPGHSPSDTIFHDAAAGIAFVGDILVANVATPIAAALPLEPDGRDELPRSLRDHREALATIAALPAGTTVLPGHGRAPADPPALIEARLAEQDERTARFLERLGEEPLSAFELARAERGRLAWTDTKSAVADALGHLELLVDAGLAAERRDDRRSSFVRI